MKLCYLSFTDRGYKLALQIADVLGGTVSRCGAPFEQGTNDTYEQQERISLRSWTEDNFTKADGLIFVGAVGIAVRAAAPHVSSKSSDPAVVAVDETGRFAVSLLSGHLGGGNDLTRKVAEACGAVPVITTATDVNNVFAVDEWSKRQNCCVLNPGRIKYVSSALLSGGTADIYCFVKISGEPPERVQQTERDRCNVSVDIHADDYGQTCDDSSSTIREPLRLVPRIAVLGIGCRRGTSRQQIEDAFKVLLSETGISEKAFCTAASIDLKKDEPGLVEFCRDHQLTFETYSSEVLRHADGDFTSSEFVRTVTGVDNVCERSAVTASKGTIYCRKRVLNGVTMSVALKPYHPDWRWKDE